MISAAIALSSSFSLRNWSCGSTSDVSSSSLAAPCGELSADSNGSVGLTMS
ncbi:hypothetical protein DPMN_177715 [Dreissena polymorpha]|uniref:Uncharacterized protein n=1 Tax=Dreissena polymorpha TaxID=45954 RepID=A0A9D4EC49_DREPO|nr:hypothetical protein DPMN_177715 [Dreissena polymorpha]